MPSKDLDNPLSEIIHLGLVTVGETLPWVPISRKRSPRNSSFAWLPLHCLPASTLDSEVEETYAMVYRLHLLVA